MVQALRNMTVQADGKRFRHACDGVQGYRTDVSDRILAAVMDAPHQPIVVRDVASPDLPVGGALLRTSCSEACGTDVHLWHGRLSGVPHPIIPGHVSAGVLARVRGELEGIDGSRLRGLHSLNDALADAAAMRLTEALVDPWLS